MKIGDTFTVKKVVTEDMTAAALGSGGLPVFGTPYLVAMVENAAFTYLQQELPEGKSTVGTKVEVSHVSPSPRPSTSIGRLSPLASTVSMRYCFLS